MCPVLSYDSRQFYREMSIGTAKPTSGELERAEHYFVDNRSIHDPVYTAGMFETEALQTLDDIFDNHNNCIAVGGSGLYIDALCYGIDDIPANENIRKELYRRWQEEGLENLQNEVAKVDPEFYAKADMKNPRRVMRALEVYQLSGKPYSSWRKNKPKERKFQTIWVGLNPDREVLFEQINRRVDEMIETGLIDEAKSLYPFRNQKALKTVGYRELFDFFDKKTDLNEAIRLIKRNSRIYAKKQLTWFQKNKEVEWFQSPDYDQIIRQIQEKIMEINF